MESNNTKARYEKYLANENKIWFNKFIWQGLDGESSYPTLSIPRFIKETKHIEVLKGINNAKKFNTKIDTLAKKYVAWAKEKDNTITTDEENSLFNFFKGVFGEFFFFHFLTDVRTILGYDKYEENKGVVSAFNYVAPRLLDETDYGVDFTADLNGQSVAIQCKFWNPYIKDSIITNQIAQGVHSDAIVNGFINEEESNNIVICWLGSTKEVSKHLKRNKKLYRHIVFIDDTALTHTINEKNPVFWENFYEKITLLSSMA